MKTIHKFPLKITYLQKIKMPIGAKILCVQSQNETPCLWAIVTTEAPLEERVIEIRGTGHELHGYFAMEYIGTFQLRQGQLVFHVFESKL
jgi:hypothetical protein